MNKKLSKFIKIALYLRVLIFLSIFASGFQEEVIFRTNAVDSNYKDGTWIVLNHKNDGKLYAYGFIGYENNIDTSNINLFQKIKFNTPENYKIYWAGYLNSIIIDTNNKYSRYSSNYCVSSSCSEIMDAKISTAKIDEYTKNKQELCTNDIGNHWYICENEIKQPCSALYYPVCGKDSVTYDNDCYMGLVNVEKGCDGKCPCPGDLPKVEKPTSKTYLWVLGGSLLAVMVIILFFKLFIGKKRWLR